MREIARKYKSTDLWFVITIKQAVTSNYQVAAVFQFLIFPTGCDTLSYLRFGYNFIQPYLIYTYILFGGKLSILEVNYLFIYSSPLDKKVANHSSILAWRIPSTEETGRLRSDHEAAKTEQLTCLPPLLSYKNVSLKANRSTVDENNSQTMLGKHMKPSHC